MTAKTYDPTPPRNVAFLGLGVMGYPMAGHLARAGHTVTVFNRSREKAERWVAAHGGLAGFPQISIPGATVDGLPVGLSILGARGSDATLVAVAQAMEARR